MMNTKEMVDKVERLLDRVQDPETREDYNRPFDPRVNWRYYVLQVESDRIVECTDNLEHAVSVAKQTALTSNLDTIFSIRDNKTRRIIKQVRMSLIVTTASDAWATEED